MSIKLKDNLSEDNILNEYTLDEFFLLGIIMQLLLQMGLMFNRLGFVYFTEAIKLCFFDPEYTKGKTKVLYPYIAKKYHVSPKTIERNMRYTLKCVDNAVANEEIYTILKLDIGCLPSCGKFIDRLTVFLLNNIEREDIIHIEDYDDNFPWD